MRMLGLEIDRCHLIAVRNDEEKGLRLSYHNLVSLLANRHWAIVRAHLTARKLLNAGLCLLEFKLHRVVLRSRPLYLKVETTDCCNLRCQHCHDGSVPRHNGFLDFDVYTRLLDQLSPTLLEVSLYDQGEPLLDPRIVEYIQYASQRNVGTVISSNFSMPLSDEMLTRLVCSGLDYLQVAIDGLSQEIYGQYRRGGQLERVLDNLKRLLRIRNELGSAAPRIEWQMIDFPFNRHEQQAARALAAELGVDRFLLKPDCYSTYPAPDYRRRSRCSLPWFSCAVECDSKLSACFIKDDETLDIGQLDHSSFDRLWNSATCRALRSRRFPAADDDDGYCARCNRFDGRAGSAYTNR